MMVLLCLPFALFGQESEEPGMNIAYNKGDQNFLLNAGMFLPLFYFSTDGSVTPALEKMNPGITGSLSWVSYLNARTYLGFEFGGVYATTLNRTFVMIPVLAKLGYMFSAYPFEFPLSLGLGLDFLKVDDLFVTTVALKPEASFYWNFSSEWAFGGNVAYWFVPELYFSAELANQSMFGNFLDIRLSVLYHF